MTDYTGHTRIGEVLRRHRVRQGMTMATIAEELGLTEGSVSRIERGDCPITVGRLKDWASLLGREPGALISEALAMADLGVEPDLSGVERERKLSADQVRDARRRHKDGESARGLADELGVHVTNLYPILNGEYYADAGGPIRGEDY